MAFDNPTGAPLDRAYFWLYPNRLAAPPAAIDDVNHYWIYPRRFNPGRMTLRSVSVARDGAGGGGRERPVDARAHRAEPHAVAGSGALWSIALPEPVPPGGRVAIALTYDAQVPARYGGFGCIDGQCALLGGFYPMPAALDAGGWDLSAAPMRADIDAAVELTAPAAGVLMGRVQAEPTDRLRARARGVPYATLIVAPRLHETRRQVRAAPRSLPDAAGADAAADRGAAGAGEVAADASGDATRTGGSGDGPTVTLRYLSASAPPPADDARDKILPYTMESYDRYALDAAERAVELLASFDAAAAGAVGGFPAELVIVEAPLRFELAAAHPGVIALSDRFYRIWPAKRFRKFHERQLVRAVLGAVVGHRVASARLEADRDADAAADLAASYLTDLYVIRQYKKREYLGDILDPVSFVPVVDQLLYAPQTMFAGAYFGGVLDDEPLRDDPRRFMHTRPRGRLYYEKLRDLLSADALRAALIPVVAQRARFRDAAEAAHGAPLGWFFRQWSLPYPRINYRLAGVTTRPVRDPDGGGRYEHEIVVDRHAAPGDRAPVEPVSVVAVLDDGHRERLRWDGAGERGVLTFRADAPIDRVIVDPSGRLVERRLPGEVADPRFDNRDEHRIRFVYNSFGVLLNVTDLSALLAVDFTLGRVHDVENQLRLSAFTSAAVKVGMTASHTRSFGPPITPDRLLSSASVTLRAQRLKGEFFADEGAPARDESRLSVSVGVGQSDKLFVFEPQRARSLGVGGTLTVTRRDAVPAGAQAPALGAEYLLAGVLSAGWTAIATPRGGHTFAVDASAAAAVGDIEARSQLIGVSGAEGLRGYGPSELFARAAALVRGEYRHVFVHDLAWNLGHYNFVRGIGGVAFVDVGALSPCESYDLASADAVYASAGYGLRFFYDSFGTLPQMMRLDVAVRLPVGARDRQCLGDPSSGGPPVMVYLGFLPPF